MNENLVLITGHYNCKNIKRTREIKKCILANALNFKLVIVFFENWDQVDDNPEYEYLKKTSNIILIKINQRQTYKIYFEYAYNNLRNNFVIIANSDILFDYTLNRVQEINMTNTLLALTRWELSDRNNWSLYTLPLQTSNEINWSYDSYIFKPSLLNIEFDLDDLDILIGIVGCDTYLIHKLSNKNILIKNPVYDIRSYHIDYRDFRENQELTYWTKDDYPNFVNNIPTNINGFDGSHGLRMTTNDNSWFSWYDRPYIKKQITAIIYCLWGQNQKYYQNIEQNVSDALEFYPDMTVILIVHELSVDLEKLKCLENWPNVIIIKRQDYYGNVLNMSWRLEILDNPHIDTILSRDLDSLILKREVVAVREWLKSGKKLHIMRDHPHHSFKILGGMFGLKKLPYLTENLSTIVSKYQYRCNEFEIDQIIMRTEIYPICCAMNDIFVNASFHPFEICARPFPITWDENYNFVGSYLEQDGSSQKYYTDILKNEIQKEWIRGVPHKDIEFIKLENDESDIFDVIYKQKTELQNKLQNKSYCFLFNFDEKINLDNIIKKSQLQDDEKILIDKSKKWIVLHFKILNELTTPLETYLEQTGNVLKY